MTLYKPSALSDQMWSWIFVLTGATMVIIFKHLGIDSGIAAGVIGGGLQSYSASFKTQQNNVNSSVKNDAVQ
jgi:hypothetical protein